MNTGGESGIQIDAGIECIERGGFDPQVRNGHLAHRYDADLRQIAACGARRVRYGISRALSYNSRTDRYDFGRYEGPLAAMRRLGLEPMLDLNHFAEWIVEPDAPRMMAEFADAVGRAFPWVTWYSIVNEPTFTAEWFGVADGPMLETIDAGYRALRATNPSARHLCADSLCLPWDDRFRRAGPTHVRRFGNGEIGWFGLLPAILERTAVDLIGLDYYHFSEWCPFEQRAGIARIGEVCERLFGAPFTISETSMDEGRPVTRIDWLREMVDGARSLRGTCPHYDGHLLWYSWISQFDWDPFFARGALLPLHDGVLDLVQGTEGDWERREVGTLALAIAACNERPTSPA